MPQIGAEIRRTDKDGINTIHRQNIVQCLIASPRFQLRHKAHFVIGGGKIRAMSRKGSGARTGTTNTAYAMRRIAHGPHQHLGLFTTFHHRHNQRLAANIQNLLDDDRFAPGRAHNGTWRMTGNDLQLCHHRRDIIR